MDDLDRIPWKKLRHAYGSAEDVPGLLRALKTASPELTGEESPLWHLFGNIWHQGTVYEATGYAVPFLIQIAADPQTPDREGVLHLLASIAHGTSFLEVHGDILHRLQSSRDARRSWIARPLRSLYAARRERQFQTKKARELKWVADARAAVAAGYDTFVAMTQEDGDVRHAAAHVLAWTRTRTEETGTLLRQLLESETRSLYRAGLILLFGIAEDRSPETASVLMNAARSGDGLQRRAAAFSLRWVGPSPLREDARQVMVEAILDDREVEFFAGLPWEPGDFTRYQFLIPSLEPADREQAANAIVAKLQNGTATDETVDRLLDLLFAKEDPNGSLPNWTPDNLSPLQVRALQAWIKAMDDNIRLVQHWSHDAGSYGLPHSLRALRELVAGRPPR